MARKIQKRALFGAGSTEWRWFGRQPCLFYEGFVQQKSEARREQIGAKVMAKSLISQNRPSGDSRWEYRMYRDPVRIGNVILDSLMIRCVEAVSRCGVMGFKQECCQCPLKKVGTASFVCGLKYSCLSEAGRSHINCQSYLWMDEI